LRELNELLSAVETKDQRPKTRDESTPHDSPSSLVLRPSSGIGAATLDGDTPRGEREVVRNSARIILSNPDMLHRSVLPNHARWAALLRSLRYVVLDESHSYRGVFGTHVALIVLRLRRLCAHYRSPPPLIISSATTP